MAGRKAESPLSGLATSVMDLLLLIVVGLLTIGSLVAAMHPAKPKAAEASVAATESVAPLLADQALLSRQRREMEGRLPSQRQLDDLRMKLEANRRLLAEQRQINESVDKQVNELQGKTEAEEREVAAVPTPARPQDTRLLESTNSDLRRQLDELEKRLQALQAEDGKSNSSFSIIPVVKAKAETSEQSLILLSRGKAYPVCADWFTGMKVSDSDVLIWPKEDRAGLVPQAALAPGSPLTKDISKPGFAKTGMVAFLVNGDSFDAYRTIRGELAKRGIRTGWEPWDGDRIHMGPGGRTIDDQ